MPKWNVTITNDKVDEIKRLLKNYGIRESGRIAGVSFYTAWCVSKGKYDTNQPLQEKQLTFSKCPITGW